MMEAMANNLKDFELACRKAGLKLTPQRVETYRELLLAQDHPTAETLHRRLRERLPAVSLDTVYRTLSTLVDHGLINRVETKESLARFEVAGVVHHHLICRRCGQIMDFQWSVMDEASLPDEIRSWGQIEQKSVVVYGICQSCLKHSV